MGTKNPEIPQNIEGAGEAPPAVGKVGGKIIEFIPAEIGVSEAPFVPGDELEIAPIVARLVTDQRAGVPRGLPINSIDEVGALQQQFEGVETTATGPARQTVIEFNRRKKDSR